MCRSPRPFLWWPGLGPQRAGAPITSSRWPDDVASRHSVQVPFHAVVFLRRLWEPDHEDRPAGRRLLGVHWQELRLAWCAQSRAARLRFAAGVRGPTFRSVVRTGISRGCDDDTLAVLGERTSEIIGRCLTGWATGPFIEDWESTPSRVRSERNQSKLPRLGRPSSATTSVMLWRHHSATCSGICTGAPSRPRSGTTKRATTTWRSKDRRRVDRLRATSTHSVGRGGHDGRVRPRPGRP